MLIGQLLPNSKSSCGANIQTQKGKFPNNYNKYFECLLRNKNHRRFILITY